MFRNLPTPPTIPQTGEFLLPVCLNVEQLKELLNAVEGKPVAIVVYQAIEFIGRETEADCID